MPKTTSVTNIALMDTASAQKLGDKKLGSLEEFVSQYTVSEQFNQINFNISSPKVFANFISFSVRESLQTTFPIVWNP